MDTDAELLELEERMWAANRAGDAAFYAELLRDDALVVSRFGVQDRASILAVIGENRVPYINSTITDPQAIELTGDSALITYRVEVEALRDGQPMNFAVLATTVYVRRDGGWCAAFHQQSAL